MELTFTPRGELGQYEWDPPRTRWWRPAVDGQVLKRLTERSTVNGLWRVGVLVLFLAASATATVLLARVSPWLALPLLYVYYFFYGFWVAIGHELQHKMVFGRSANWFSEIVYFFVQLLMWNSPRYARISHRLHHRYTMVRGVDPETDWPEVITSKWLRGYLRGLVLRILVVGAIPELGRDVMSWMTTSTTTCSRVSHREICRLFTAFSRRIYPSRST